MDLLQTFFMPPTASLPHSNDSLRAELIISKFSGNDELRKCAFLEARVRLGFPDPVSRRARPRFVAAG